jgi:site-specific DNA recombinase
MYDDVEIDITKLRYVLYARKSTDDPKNQRRSIPDQIIECQEFARRNELTIVGKPLIEKESAKSPGRRPIFRQMLNDLKAGKFDGILSWHPDRLARNMLEGGEVIHLVDEGYIKDLKFVAHPFSNDPSGKMLLGLAFAISKHYSDDLSQKVTRGNRRSFFEGKLWTPKHGYLVDDSYYKPDGNNFKLIKQAWQKRKKNESIESISEFLNENGYYKQVKSTEEKITMTPQILSKIFKDSFYYGLITRYNKFIDLREMYEFEPAVSEADYNSVQQLDYRSIKSTKPHRLSFYPLRQMVLCSFCGRRMVVGPSTGRLGIRYLNYRCDNKACERKKKSIRAFNIFDYITEFLRGGLSLTKQEYDDYLHQLTGLAKARRQRSAAELNRLRGALKATRSEIEQVSERLMKIDPENRAAKYAEAKLAKLEENEVGLSERVETIQQKLTDPQHDRVSFEQFLNLSKNAATKIQHGGPVQKDILCRFIFLNLTVNEEKVVNFELKEPFRTLLAERKKAKLGGSGHDHNQLE